MPEFEYVSRREAHPFQNDIKALIHRAQNDVRKYFTFSYEFIGSSSRNMITREKKSNIGFDFDVNLTPNKHNEEYTAAEIRRKIFDALQRHMKRYGYTDIEDSTSVITIKVVVGDRIIRSCDFAIVRTNIYGKQQYIHFEKYQIPFYFQTGYGWRDRGGLYDIEDKLQWIKENDLSQELRNQYLNNKNHNFNHNKKSRAIFAETVNNIYNQYNNRGLIYPFRMGLH